MSNQTISKTPPRHLATEAKKMWKVIVPYLNSNDSPLDSVDATLVEMYCTQYGIYRDAYTEIREHGIQTEAWKTVQNSAGEAIGKDFQGYKRNPATTIFNDALKQLTAIGAQLGLSPKSRAELSSIGTGSDVDVKAELGKMFGGQ